MISQLRLAGGTLTALAVLSLASVAVTQARGPAGPPGPAAGKPGGANIVEIAQAVNANSGEFSYLLAAATCPDLGGSVVALLSGPGQQTLFAPTDAAFEALQAALGIAAPAPQATCALPAAQLLDVLAYHVVQGRRLSNSVFSPVASKPVRMLNGQFVIANADLTLSDNAGQAVGVVADLIDISASNGVIHVVDTVLLPFAP